jgi:hypothetical protein
VDLRLDLHPVTVIQGENATGKTNVYRALSLLSRGAAGELARSLLEEGGMPSALAAIPPRGRKPGPVRMRLGAVVDDFSYELALGLPSVDPGTTRFALDAEIKEESAWFGPKRTRQTELLDRSGATASARDVDGANVTFAMVMDRFEPALSQLGEPARFPELFALRERLRGWRFYHQLPTGPDAPARSPRSGVRTPVMANDGRDLAAALATIVDMGNGQRAKVLTEFRVRRVVIHRVGRGRSVVHSLPSRKGSTDQRQFAQRNVVSAPAEQISSMRQPINRVCAERVRRPLHLGEESNRRCSVAGFAERGDVDIDRFPNARIGYPCVTDGGYEALQPVGRQRKAALAAGAHVSRSPNRRG